ncbi:MAG: stage II sporulation protein M [Candidatus Aenigmarchaeota archaeon]|nr:stage II sporulation protein M [Candidatus Aenigmarchaeota archaeon]
MVLESIMNPKNAEDKPAHVFFIALIYSVISMYFANQLFPKQASLLSIALITIVFVPFFQKLFEIEEEAEDEAARGVKGNLFSRHKKIIFVFSSFFLGVTVAVAFSFIFMPKETFSLQAETLRGFSGLASGSGAFSTFFVNNSQVMLLMFILSTMFGAGAIFILAWNASVIGVYAGNFMQAGLDKGALLYGVPLSLSSIALHGIPEILAYFVAGLAGGILSVGIIRERFMSKEFKKIFKDSAILLFSAEFLIAIGAWLEAAF